MQVVVLGGGNSTEREVSLRSSKAVSNALREAGFDVSDKDPADGLDFLDELPKDSIVFPILHGKGGEDGVLQAELEKREIKFLGSSSEVSKNCFDKATARKILTENGVRMARASIVTIDNFLDDPLYKIPHVLKPARSGSALGASIIRDVKEIDDEKSKETFNFDDKAVLEELIVGPEITVPILGEKALPVIEIIPPDQAEFDYENRYNGRTEELIPPLNVSEEKQREAQAIAEKVHKVLDCRHFSRVDMMINELGEIFVLEINTIPGMTDQSLFPKSAEAAGMPMPELMKELVRLINS